MDGSPHQILGALRDGYREATDAFFSQVQREAARLLRERPLPLAQGLVERWLRDVVPPWAHRTREKLERDARRAARIIVAHATGREPDDPLAGWSPGPPPPLPSPPALGPPGAVRLALRRGSGTALLLWLAAFLALPAEFQNPGYVVSVLLGLLAGYHRYRALAPAERRRAEAAVTAYLEGLRERILDDQLALLASVASRLAEGLAGGAAAGPDPGTSGAG